MAEAKKTVSVDDLADLIQGKRDVSTTRGSDGYRVDSGECKTLKAAITAFMSDLKSQKVAKGDICWDYKPILRSQQDVYSIASRFYIG